MVRYIDIAPGLMMQDLAQVKQAAVEQIRTARQTGEEACWHCGRPATETCSGSFLFRIFGDWIGLMIIMIITIMMMMEMVMEMMMTLNGGLNIVQGAAWRGIVASCANTR